MANYEFPKDLVYSREDEWVRREEERAVVGISDYAQQQLGDIVFVELPEVGTEVEVGDPFGVVESVKAVSDLYAPIAGRIVESNGEIADHPEYINEDCYGDGWLVVIEPTDKSDFEELLAADAYRTFCDERSED